MRSRIAWEEFQKEWFESKWLRHLVGGFAAFLEFFTVEFSQFFSMCLLRSFFTVVRVGLRGLDVVVKKRVREIGVKDVLESSFRFRCVT